MSAAPPLPPNYERPGDDRQLSVVPPQRHRRALWQRVLLWIGLGIAALVLLVVIAIAFILRSDTAHQYILRTAQQRATEALGSQVKIRDYKLTFSGISPTLDLYNVVVDGAAPYPNPPLLTVEHARVGVRIVSLMQKKWYLTEAVVVRPVVRVFVDKEGKDNLPQTKTQGQKSNTNLFDLAVQHAVLQGGELYYNNRKSVIDADLHELDFQSSFDNANPRYYGAIAYSNGHLKLETFDTIAHDFSGKFEYTPDRFVLSDAVLRSGASRLNVNATARNLDEQPVVDANYSAQLDTGESRRILKNPTLPVGVVDLHGNLKYASRPNIPALQAVDLEGALSSKQLQLRTAQVNTSLRNLAANYSVRNGDLQVRNLHGNVMGGTLNGELTMRDLAGASRSNLSATLRGVSLAEAKSVVDSPALRKLGVTGTLNADADANWGKTFKDMTARANANLNARVTPAGAGAQPVPVDGVVNARYSAKTEQLTLTNSFVRLPQTELTLNGTVSQRSALNVNLRANDLHQLEAIAAMFQTAPQPLGLYGTASFAGSVTGSTASPNIRGRLLAANLRVKGSSWRSLRTDVDASPSHAALHNGELVAVPRGRVSFDVQTHLAQWAFTKNSEFQASIKGDQLNVENLVRAAGSTAPINGTLKLNVNAHGTQLAPMGDGAIELTNAKVSGETIQNASVKFHGTGDAVRANLAVRLPAGAADGVIDYFPKQQGYDANIRANGIKLEQLATLKARNMNVSGVLNLNAAGRGTFNDPQLVATAVIPELAAQGQKISGITLRADVANHVANVTLDSRVINTSLNGRATINLSGDYPMVAKFDTGNIPLQPLVAVYAPEQAGDLTGQTEIHANLRGPLKNKNAIEGQLEIPILAVNYRNAVQIGAPQPIRMQYANGVLQVQRSALRGTGTDLQFQGTVPITNSSAAMSLLLQGTVDLRLARVLNPDMEAAGQLVFDVNSYGNRADPNVQGQVKIVNASVATGDMPLGLQNGNGVVTVTRDRLEVTRFEGTVGGGTVRASGGVRYRPAVDFDLALLADNIRLLYPEGLRSGVGANVTLTGTRDEAYLRGQINIDQVSFTPDFDLMGMMGSFGGTTATPPAQGFSNNLLLDLTVQSPQGINLASRELSLDGGVNLTVSGTAAQPVILGRVNLNSGDLIFRGNRYLLQNATVDFANPSRTEPVLNASVETTIQQYNIAMQFRGPVDRMRTSYTSDPALPPADIINLLAFGKTTEAAAANPNPPGTLGAQSAIASAVAGQVTSRLEKVAGISHLSIDPTLGGTGQGSQSGPGATVTIQQRVTSKLFVTFSTDVTSTERQVIQLEYRVNPRFSLSGTRDQNGGFAVDTRFRRNW